MMEELKVQLLALIQDTFKCNRDQAQYFYLSIMDCVRRKDLVSPLSLQKSRALQGSYFSLSDNGFPYGPELLSRRHRHCYFDRFVKG